MLYRHTRPLLFLALSFALCVCLAARLRPHSHVRPLRSKRNHAFEANNASLRFELMQSPGGECPRGRGGPPPLSELRTMIDSHVHPTFHHPSPSRVLTCLPKLHYPCPPDGDACASDGLCAPTGSYLRLRRARILRLANCPHLTLFSVLSQDERAALHSVKTCCSLARHLKERDALVERFLRIQDILLERSSFKDDCSFGGSEKDSNMCGGAPPNGCVTCKEAYRRWVCSQLFVFYDGAGCPVRPCDSICHCVEQKCPYFLPQQKPVAGEPSFLCEDPSVGVENAIHSLYSSSPCCYEPCTSAASLGHLHERTNMSTFALCLRETFTPHRDCEPRVSMGKPQCLSVPNSDCGCGDPFPTERIVSSAGRNTVWTMLHIALSRTLLLRPRGFT